MRGLICSNLGDLIMEMESKLYKSSLIIIAHDSIVKTGIIMKIGRKKSNTF